MRTEVYELNAIRIVIYVEGPELQNGMQAAEIIASTLEHDAKYVAIPIERLSNHFFRLSSRVAGEIIQKFLTYNLNVVIVGDISKTLEESSAFRDFVYESNRGDRIWFVKDFGELNKRLESLPPISLP